MAFHDERFPVGISYGSTGGPERRTIVVEAGSGHEHRNAQWADSRRSYNAGTGVKSMDDIHRVLTFFEERRGRLHGFLWQDHSDYKSCQPSGTPAATDQPVGTGDGSAVKFQLKKTYGNLNPYTRDIKKPVEGTVQVAADGSGVTNFTVDHTTGVITFDATPVVGVSITAGFEFDTPVRFDTDRLEIDLAAFKAGQIPRIPIVEIRL